MLHINDKKILLDVKHLDSSFLQAKGAMFNFNKKNAYIFSFTRPRKDIVHMLFVFFCLDIIWLDEHKNIIDLHYRARPFIDFIPFKKRSAYMLEFPSGTLKKYNISIGQPVRW